MNDILTVVVSCILAALWNGTFPPKKSAVYPKYQLKKSHFFQNLTGGRTK